MAITITGSQNLSAVVGITQTDLTHSTVADGITFAASSTLTIDKSSFQCQQILLNNTTAALNTGANNGDGSYAKNAIIFIQPSGAQNQQFSTNPPMSLLGKCNLLNTEFIAGSNIAPTEQSTFIGEYPTQAAALTGGADRILKNVQFRAVNKNGVTIFIPQATLDNVTFDRIDLVFFEAQPTSSNNLKVTNSSWGLVIYDKSLSFSNSVLSRVTVQKNSVTGNAMTLTNVAVSERYMFRNVTDLTGSYILKTGFVGVSGTDGAIACIFNGSNTLLNAATSDANGNWAQVNLTWATFTAGSVGANPTVGTSALPNDPANFVTSANITTWQTTTPAKFTSLVVPIKVLHMGYAYQSQYQEIATIDTTLAAYAAPFSYSAKLPADLNVTLSNASALALLTSAVTINKATNTVTLASAVTVDNLYDAAKAFKTKADGTNAAYPSPATSFFTATGTTVDFGSMPIAGVNNLTSGTKFQTLKTSGSITASGSMANLSIQGNVSQATPTNFTGVNITGNLVYNTNTPITVTFTNCTISGTISNSGTGLVKVVKAGTTPWLTGGSNVSVIANVVVETPGGLALSTYIVKNGATDLGWVATNAARSLEIQESDTFSIYAIAYGYKAKLISATATDLTSFEFELLPEPYIDTSLSTVTRNFIASKFSTALDAYNRIALSVNYDLRYYTPDEVMNAVQYYITTEGNLIAAGVLYGGTIDGVEIIQGGIIIGTPGFYGKVNDSVTTTTNLGILIPIYIDVLPAVYVADPTYTPVLKNSSGIVLQTAPWTKMTADISALDKTDIREGLALEASLALKADQATVVLIPTNPLLTTDARLNTLDVAVSTRLAASGYTAPTTPPTAAQNATAVRSELTTELGRIDATVSSRLAASGYIAPTTSPTAAQNATAVRSELAIELARIDAAVTTRLAASGYTPGTTAPTSAEVATAVRAELALELARVDVAVSTRLAASGYTPGTNAPTSEEVAAAVRTELAAELARIDAGVSTRLAASGYTSPDNASIASIKNVTALIPALL